MILVGYEDYDRFNPYGDDDDDDDVYLDEYHDLHLGDYASIEDKLRQILELSNCNMTFT